MEDLTKEFIAESQEGLDRMERCLTTLEARPDDPELIAEIFRAVHSIKGTTGFLGFGRLEALAHCGETLLGLVRDGKVRVTAELVSGLLGLLDGLRHILSLIEETGGEGRREEDDEQALIQMLVKLGVHVGGHDHSMAGSDYGHELDGSSGRSKPPGVRADDLVASVAVESVGANERTLRVDVDVLNRMVNLVGELVLTRNQILQSSFDARGFAQLGRRLDIVTAELREAVMQARMQPVGQVFSKFPRLVRDLAKMCGKRVRIEFSGQATELDKSLLEAIKDPLTHAVRNCVDHGIEMPAMRVAAGKPEEGVLHLRAFHRGGAVVIELMDDGAGIHVDVVRAKAVERRLTTSERMRAMSDPDVIQMVFLPGFSTAETVTHLSGRGVGLDVVRANVEKVGGAVELETREGSGTTLRLRVPLTLAIVPALIVVSGGQSFALPQSALVELVYVSEGELAGALEEKGGTEFYHLREWLLPVARLDRLLGIEAFGGEPRSGFYLAVLDLDGCRFGLVLDDLLAPEEIVVKPISLELREIGMYSGATVLGSGTLALILDVGALAVRAGVGAAFDKITKDQVTVPPLDQAADTRLLLFDGATAAGGEKIAIRLDQVERVESIAVDSVEYIGGRAVLQRQGEALPLQDDAGLLKTSDDGRSVTVLICTDGHGGRLGLVVSEVSHVAVGTLLPRAEGAARDGLALVEGRLTLVRELESAVLVQCGTLQGVS